MTPLIYTLTTHRMQRLTNGDRRFAIRNSKMNVLRSTVLLRRGLIICFIIAKLVVKVKMA